MNINNKEIELVIFDMDGVIVSTDELHYESWKKIFDKWLNIKLEDSDKDLVRGVSRSDSLSLLIKKYNKQVDEETFNHMLVEKNKHYIKSLNSLKSGDEHPFLNDLILFLKNKKIKTVIASSSKNAPTILEKLNLIESFDYIVNANEIKNFKPDPEIFLAAAKIAGDIAPEKCVVIEDAQAGIDGAKAANMQVIAFADGNSKMYNYDNIVRNHKDIIALLEE